ncbi:GNAT family N-acetyltransferase [Paenibacillus sp. GCM10023248]|uniref:GNAT family N-acetyltransferase n=1 Tax=Bacillales TaxID=1385 RepID=UPI0023782405|nr:MULTISPECIES: GNAT family N-acetyltransferase [Bacillales]MDD9269053.1 GNAT family N-acetyltransferase [Paenibacillus sp. MAHUQ-63]MDR6885452.1 GNAT superfamily N-acetyltransferase [Bacillus sp. 3255]
MATGVRVLVRDARPEERDAAVALTLEAYRQYEISFGQPFWEQYISNINAQWDRKGDEVQRIVAFHGTKLAGAVLYYPPQAGLYEKLQETIPYPEIRLLGVHPSARGQGVATALIGACAQRAREADSRYLGLHTSGRMPDAVRLYRKLGFERETRFDFLAADHRTVVEAYRLALITN